MNIMFGKQSRTCFSEFLQQVVVRICHLGSLPKKLSCVYRKKHIVAQSFLFTDPVVGETRCVNWFLGSVKTQTYRT